MKATAPDLFDRAALARARARAGLSDSGQWFLHDLAADEIEERLEMVNRRFHRPALVGPRAEQWAQRLGLDALCVADEDVLALEPGGHDLVIHAFALHLANDPVGQLIQMNRALEPDGLMLAIFPAGRTLAELREALTRAEAELTGGLSPRVAPMAEIRALGGLLQRAGFALPVADVQGHTVTYASLLHLMRDLRAMGEVNCLSGRLRRFTPRRLFERAAELYPGIEADGRLRATVELACLTGWAPAEDQPKPLRPGSAQTRLAEALGTREHKLPD